MDRKFSDRNSVNANENNKGEMKAMSVVDAFTPDLAARYARKMLERETRGNGDQMNALERVGRRCGMTGRSLRRLLSGEIKDPGITVFSKIRTAYLDLCSRQIEELKTEIATDRARFGNAAFADFDDEVQALAEKLRQAREGASP